jgi:hypothetical protein
MSIKIPYMRKGISSTLLAFSAIALLLGSLLLPLSNFIQPVQAQTSMTFRTTTESPADGNSSSDGGGDSDSDSNVSFRAPTSFEGSLCTPDRGTITFDAQGTASSGYQNLNVTGGTYQITSSSGGQILYSGTITSGRFTNNSGGGQLTLEGEVHRVPSGTACASTGQGIAIFTSCSTSDRNEIEVFNVDAGIYVGDFDGPVECSPSQGVGHDTQASSMTGTAHDSDGDGIHDSSDKCPHNSNTRCYKEG